MGAAMDPVVCRANKQTFNGWAYFKDRRGYYRHQGAPLHRAVWEYHNGPIPEGHHIHHIDERTDNNALSNLLLIEAKDHAKLHFAQEETERRLREGQKAWLASDVGQATMSEHGKRVAHFMRQPKTFTCAHCETSFETTTAFARFCCNRCKQRWRLKNGPRAVEYTCTVCGTPYIGDRYAPSESCSRKCRGVISSRTKRAKVASTGWVV